MEQNLNPNPEPPETPPILPAPLFCPGKREYIFGIAVIVLSVLLFNFTVYGGFSQGFAFASAGLICCTALYLRRSGRKFGAYETALLLLSLTIALGFARSADGFVKFVMVIFLFFAVNLCFCLAAGQNRRSPGSAASLLDAPRAFWRLGMGNLSAAGSGVVFAVRTGGAATRRFGAVTTGIVVSAPLVLIICLLLMRADAAFEGLLDLLPEFNLTEYLLSALWGTFLGWILYSRGVALNRSPRPEAALQKDSGIQPLTLGTVLVMVDMVYLIYLLSQLAYLSGGLAGIVPEEYTLSQYARRGFFEMAVLSGLNLGVVCLVIRLATREGKLPVLVRAAGTFLGAVTVFLIITASAKMLLYIGSYGLTRLRVLTQVIMLWLGLTTVLITIRLHVFRFPYMKAVVLTALVLGALVFWLDVNTVVAEYNVHAYLTGQLRNVDVSHLDRLGSPAVPALIRLAEEGRGIQAQMARDVLERKILSEGGFRSWNYADYLADWHLLQWMEANLK